MNKQKGSILVVILLLLAGAGLVFVGYKYAFKQKVQETPLPTSTSNPTTDWKTFTSNITGYQISYPPDFYVSNKPENLGDPLILLKNLDGNKHISIGLSVDAQGTTCANALCNQRKNINVSFGGKQLTAEQVWPDIYGEFTLEFYQDYPKGNSMIKVSAEYPDEKDLEQIDQILSTFKFLDEPRKCLQIIDPCNPQGCNYDQSKCNN